MSNNKLLEAQILVVLTEDAAERELSGDVSFDLRPEIENGYTTGYEMLHGPHSFELSGTATVLEDGNIRYDLTATWNDVIDPNLTYHSDKVLADFLTKYYTPQDYKVSITWTTSYTIKK
ncbi:MAG: hypothetical protein JJ971_13530 [Balneolaceae bacterium]|nr:hypothetical protein [Balneolaceae bacterium]MBO6547123.1 hypothetical protein [Balneolaceae bacterium]MBO6647930.1 hypothetical protein [Balneolaceae bacterium]